MEDTVCDGEEDVPYCILGEKLEDPWSAKSFASMTAADREAWKKREKVKCSAP